MIRIRGLGAQADLGEIVPIGSERVKPSDVSVMTSTRRLESSPVFALREKKRIAGLLSPTQ